MGFVQVTGGGVLWGTMAGNVATPSVNSNCYFDATANGVTINQAGIAAGVDVLVYLFHNGTLPAQCTTYGSKGHWAQLCGSASPDCGDVLQCQ
jgi:hypothetical protein